MTAPTDSKKLRHTLKSIGLSDAAISAAWPGWWSDEAEGSLSASTELRFSLARKLGLDPRSMLDSDGPRFVWHDETKFKRRTTESDSELAAINAFGVSLARALVAATKDGPSVEGMDAIRLRRSILASQDYVRLIDLLGLCWAMGIPVIHLQIFPLSGKRMCAMSVRVGHRHAILLGKDSNYPAPIAYYLAHEIGHVALGHMATDTAVVDLLDPLNEKERDDDPDEIAADKFAIELLTGSSEFRLATEVKRFGAKQLATSILATAQQLQIEPGTMALCFGHTTGEWAKATAAMKAIYAKEAPVWTEVNRVAANELDWSAINEDFAFFIKAVMGGIGRESRRRQ